MRRIALVLLALLTLGPGFVGQGAAGAQTPRPPSSMAAIGDSITRAADVCCWYGDHPAHSWSTGWSATDGVLSHYERLRTLNPAIAGHAYNDAVSGARMSDAPGQARAAVSQHVQYVTIEMGANDVCTSSPSTMTPVATFRTEFRQTLQILAAGLPSRAHIYVASIPDIYRLWSVYHTDDVAEFVWSVAGICQSMLSPARTEDDRLLVRQRNIDFNTVLAEECATYVRCRFDGNAVFGYQFERSDVSKLDYFHPSLAGQAGLAQVTWSTSWWNS